MKQYELEISPDVLILPSVLNRFSGVSKWSVKISNQITYSIFSVKRVKDTLCINPGQLSKGQAGGTYASMSILPLSEESLSKNQDAESQHFLLERSYVEIARI